MGASFFEYFAFRLFPRLGLPGLFAEWVFQKNRFPVLPAGSGSGI
jgi:hypothetical protein